MYANDPDNKVGQTPSQITQMCIDVVNTIEKGDIGVMFLAKLEENKVNLKLLILVARGTHVSKEQQEAMNNLLDILANQIRQANPASLESASRPQ